MTLLLVGCAMGGDLIARGEAYLEANGEIPSEVVIGVAGSGRLAHAVALHSLQVLAVLALLLGRLAGPASRRTRLMTVAAVGIMALAGLVAAQAYAGRSMLDLSLPMGLGIAAAVALVAATFAVALLGVGPGQRGVERLTPAVDAAQGDGMHRLAGRGSLAWDLALTVIMTRDPARRGRGRGRATDRVRPGRCDGRVAGVPPVVPTDVVRDQLGRTRPHRRELLRRRALRVRERDRALLRRRVRHADRDRWSDW